MCDPADEGPFSDASLTNYAEEDPGAADHENVHVRGVVGHVAAGALVSWLPLRAQVLLVTDLRVEDAGLDSRAAEKCGKTAKFCDHDKYLVLEWSVAIGLLTESTTGKVERYFQAAGHYDAAPAEAEPDRGNHRTRVQNQARKRILKEKSIFFAEGVVLCIAFAVFFRARLHHHLLVEGYLEEENHENHVAGEVLVPEKVGEPASLIIIV
jgi:hypothetical protein